MDLNTYLETHGAAVSLSRALKVTPAVISQWKCGVRPIPAHHCPMIEFATGGKVSCEELRPDIEWGYLRRASTMSVEPEPAIVGVGATAPEPHQEAA